MTENNFLNLQLVTTMGIPTAARKLIWDVFFAKRDRGFSFDTHFPWAKNNENTVSITLVEQSVSGAARAALVVREDALKGIGKIGLIGLVCVDEPFRGYNLTGRLLDEAIKVATSRNLAGLVLWTTKPKVYARHQFEIDQSDMCSDVLSPQISGKKPDKQKTDIIRNSKLEGVPPSAKQIIELKNDLATIQLLELSTGFMIVGYQGAIKDVMELIQAEMPSKWQLIAPMKDPIFDLLSQAGYTLNSKDGAVRMWRPIGEAAATSIPYIEFLDRI